MNQKPTPITLVIFGLCLCLSAVADDEAKLMQENPNWHITSEVYANPPYWLVPTNVPFRLAPLSNGKWVWTTNAPTGWFGPDGMDIGMDGAREQQLRQQWEKEHQQMNDANDPPGIANVPEYRHRTWFQKRVWNTNVVKNWQGIWVEDTNTGWRVNLCSISNNAVFAGVVVIKVGSLVSNSGAGLLPSPDGKYAKLQLLDSNGKAVPPKRGAARKLFELKYPVLPESAKRGAGSMFFDNLHPPSGSDASVERDYPNVISDLEYPRWQYNSGRRNGWFVHYAGFVSNGPPCAIGIIKLYDIFPIKTEGDYTFTVQPVLFRQHYEGGTFQGYLDRVDLPSVTTKVHLVPNK